MSEHTAENDAACRFGTHAPRDCPARVFALNGSIPPTCPIPSATTECGR